MQIPNDSSFTVQITTSANHVECEDLISVECKCLQPQEIYWLGIFLQHATDKQYLSCQYPKTVDRNSVYTATATFQVPKHSGVVNFRSFKRGARMFEWQQTGISDSVPVVYPQFMCTHEMKNGSIHLQVKALSNVPHPNAWIGLYEKQNKDSDYESYQKLNAPEKVFAPPKGAWHFRIFISDYIQCGVYPEEEQVSNVIEPTIIEPTIPTKSTEQREKFIIKITPEEEDNIVQQLNNQFTQTIKIGLSPVYVINVSQEQAKSFEQWPGVVAVIKDRVVATVENEI